MEKILSEHARKRKQLRIETATILVHEFGEFWTINSGQSDPWSDRPWIPCPIYWPVTGPIRKICFWIKTERTNYRYGSVNSMDGPKRLYSHYTYRITGPWTCSSNFRDDNLNRVELTYKVHFGSSSVFSGQDSFGLAIPNFFQWIYLKLKFRVFSMSWLWRRIFISSWTFCSFASFALRQPRVPTTKSTPIQTWFIEFHLGLEFVLARIFFARKTLK